MDSLTRVRRFDYARAFVSAFAEKDRADAETTIVEARCGIAALEPVRENAPWAQLTNRLIWLRNPAVRPGNSYGDPA